MKKIINITVIIFLIGIITINFISYKASDSIRILVKYGSNYDNVFDEYINQKNIDVIIDYYYNNDEIYNLVLNNKYDLVIIPFKQLDILNNNKLTIDIDKSKIPNYRNIDNEYLSSDNKYIPFALKDDDLYVISILKKNDYKALYLIDYILRGDVMAKIVINNNYTSINWTSKYYID